MTYRLGAMIAIVSTLIIPPVATAELALKRAMLSTGGVAYLEHEAEVSGDGLLTLDVPLDQIDDVLKSIVVYDSAGGVGSASLAGRNPLDQLYADLPFGAEALNSTAALLNALQGAEIKVVAGRPMTGKVLNVVAETVQRNDHDTQTRNRVSVLTATGLQQFLLEDAESVAFVDPALQAQVDKTLSAIATHHAKDRRQITLTIRGTGTRLVRVGYVVGAPLWKASFRMTLPQPLDAKTAHLQGWAVLENMSGQDWKGVELTLLSGNPVSFRQALYQAYYVSRPEVPVEVTNRILPPPDSGGVKVQEAESQETMQKSSPGRMRAMAMPAPPAMVAALPSVQRPTPALDELRSRAAEPASAEEGATQVSFRLPTPVAIESGRSAIVPIFDRDMPIERVDLYQPQTSVLRPLASIRIKNDSPVGLPPGVLTIYEEGSGGVAYAGDARLAQLPAGETRLLSYAVDEKTKVLRDEKSTSTVTSGSIAQGVVSIRRTVRYMTTYTIAAPTAEDRTLVIEHPKRAGLTLAEPKEGRLDETASAYRFGVSLKAGETKTVKVVTETPSFQTMQVADITEDRITILAEGGLLDPAIRAALAEVARLRRTLDVKMAAEEEIKTALTALDADQARIRDNLPKVDEHSALHDRYLKKLADQENQYEAYQTAATKAAGATRDARAAINAYIAGLKI